MDQESKSQYPLTSDFTKVYSQISPNNYPKLAKISKNL